MKYLVVAGVGRSGTTFLARLMALSTTPMKVVMEPFPRAARHPNNGQVEPWSALPGSPGVKWARRVLAGLTRSNKAINADVRDWTVEREDEGFGCVLVKLTHSLLALPEILKGLDYRCVAITRETARVIDSFFHGHTQEMRHYLQDEYKWLGFPHVSDEAMRQALVTQAVKTRLVAWAMSDARVVWLTFEELCLDPLWSCRRAFDFFGLDYDEEAGAALARMTHGGQTGYYDTEKDSLRILRQEFKFLTREQVEEIRCL